MSPQPSFCNDTQTGSHRAILCTRSKVAAVLLPGCVERLLNCLEYLSQLAQNLLIWVFPSGPTLLNAPMEIFPLLPIDVGPQSEHPGATNFIHLM